ncbi:MAG: diguanylate cyclase [Chitinispirillia bacterium]|nr:diguanylate cyclase [Chitinispirillia bacterium]MCL2268405.1 diguanylate cyclase [Chitinispirillia bacterium]
MVNPGEQKRFSILVVDDETSNIDVLSHVLKEKYKLFVAKNGEGAIKIARDNQPDLILLDVIMPGMDGFEVLTQLRKSDVTASIPVIFITGQDSKENEIKGLNLGAVDYITKPFHNIIVDARVRTHMKIVEQMRIIERMSIMDELTDLPNRRYFNDQLVREWGRAIRETSSITLLIIDVDKFKVYNDTYGHPQGDALLQAISGVFKNALKRPADFVARWGGEEFIMLMPHTDLDGALEVAERVRSGVENLVIPCTDGTLTGTTVSIGINCERPIISLPVAGFVSRADKALYAAKDAGRNRVCVYKEGQLY